MLNAAISKCFVFILLGDLLILITQSIETVQKLGSLALMLEINDWEFIISSAGLQPARLQSARLVLAEKIVKSRRTKEDLEVTLRQPALMAMRSAEKLSRDWSGVSGGLSIVSSPPSSSTGSIPQQYRKSHIG